MCVCARLAEIRRSESAKSKRKNSRAGAAGTVKGMSALRPPMPDLSRLSVADIGTNGTNGNVVRMSVFDTERQKWAPSVLNPSMHSEPIWFASRNERDLPQKYPNNRPESGDPELGKSPVPGHDNISLSFRVQARQGAIDDDPKWVFLHMMIERHPRGHSQRQPFRTGYGIFRDPRVGSWVVADDEDKVDSFNAGVDGQNPLGELWGLQHGWASFAEIFYGGDAATYRVFIANAEVSEDTPPIIIGPPSFTPPLSILLEDGEHSKVIECSVICYLPGTEFNFPNEEFGNIVWDQNIMLLVLRLTDMSDDKLSVVYGAQCVNVSRTDLRHFPGHASGGDWHYGGIKAVSEDAKSFLYEKIQELVMTCPHFGIPAVNRHISLLPDGELYNEAKDRFENNQGSSEPEGSGKRHRS